jgi:superfamily II DNA or RNA helicase
MTSLSRQGYSVKKTSFDEKDIESVKRELTVEVKNGMFDNIAPKRYVLYQENDTKLYIPKYYGLQRFGVPDRNVISDGEHRPNMNFIGTLRENQVLQVNAFLEACKDPNKMGGLINLGCGNGKSIIAIAISCILKVKILFVSHKEFLNVQFAERITQFCPEAKIGIIKQNKVDIEDKDFVVGSLQSIAMRDYDPSIFKDFGLVIIDEVHHCAAEVFCRALVKTCSKYTLGLSATLNRKDGLQRVFKWYIGTPVIKLVHNKNDDSDVDVKLYYFNDNNPKYCKIETIYNKISPVKMLGNVVSYKPRVLFCCKAIIENMSDDRKMIVLSERKSLLYDIHTVLSETPGFKYTMGFYVGGMTQKKLEESSSTQIILGSNSMLAEGYDNQLLNSIILVSPMGEIEQQIGRILRLQKENRKVKPLVIDIVDNFSIFINRFNKRKAYYSKNNYNIIIP